MTTPENMLTTCERCRSESVAPVVMDSVYTHAGKTVNYKDEFMRCANCEREFYTHEQSMARNRAITNALRSAEGFLTGDEIRNARLRYELSLPEFEKALGVGKNTVGRWERGTVPPSAAANLGLWVAANHPKVFEEWAAMRGITVKSQQKQVALGFSTSAAPAESTTTIPMWSEPGAVRGTTSRPLSLVPETS